MFLYLRQTTIFVGFCIPDLSVHQRLEKQNISCCTALISTEPEHPEEGTLTVILVTKAT